MSLPLHGLQAISSPCVTTRNLHFRRFSSLCTILLMPTMLCCAVLFIIGVPPHSVSSSSCTFQTQQNLTHFWPWFSLAKVRLFHLISLHPIDAMQPYFLPLADIIICPEDLFLLSPYKSFQGSIENYCLIWQHFILTLLRSEVVGTTSSSNSLGSDFWISIEISNMSSNRNSEPKCFIRTVLWSYNNPLNELNLP